MTQLFVNEEEMREYFKIHPELKYQWSQTTEYGVLASSQFKKDLLNKEEVSPELKHYIYTYYYGKMMYLASKGTTFIKANAKPFSKKDAETKIQFMNQKGMHEWQVI